MRYRKRQGNGRETGIFVGIKGSFHLSKVGKEADEMNGSKSFTPLHTHVPDPLNEADITSLMTPCFVNDRWVQCHTCQPDAVGQLIGTDEPIRHFAIFPPIQVAGVRREVIKEGIGRAPR